MPSRELLDRLFAVESEARALLDEAREEARRRVAAAKEEAETAFKRAYERKAAELERGFAEGSAKCEAEYASLISSYREALASAPEDEAAFDAVFDAFLDRKA